MDALNNRNALFFSHGFDKDKLRFLRFSLNLLTTNTCQS